MAMSSNLTFNMDNWECLCGEQNSTFDNRCPSCGYVMQALENEMPSEYYEAIRYDDGCPLDGKAYR